MSRRARCGTGRPGRFPGRRGVAMAVAVTLVLSLTGNPPAWAEPSPGLKAHRAHKERSVPGREVGKEGGKERGRAAENAPPASSKAAWPAAATATVDLPAAAPDATTRAAERAADLEPAPGLPVRVGAGRAAAARSATAAARSATSAAPVGRVRVAVLDRQATRQAGVDGVLLRIARADGAAAAGKVSVEVDYSGFRDAFGGDWAARLRLLRLPECALRTPRSPACQGTPVPSSNTPAAGRVTADLDAAPDGGGLFALAAAPAGSNGDYRATSLAPSATWVAGGSSGDFNWSYGMRVPPSAGNLAPPVGLSYSSGAVDGQTVSTNSQPSWAGQGFETWPGYVERKYMACGDDMTGGNNAARKTGDLCWGPQNATLTLNGATKELVRDAGTGRWRLGNDDGSRVELLTQGANGDNDGEYWKVTTGDGTQYFFGLHRLPGWAAGRPETNSAWTVPVFGNHAGDPCHQAAFGASWCQQTWRWNLDYVVDPHDNTITYYYKKETNHYGRDLTAAAATPYTRGGTLDRAEYGTRRGTEYQTPAPYIVDFAEADRCVTAGATCVPSQPANWPDTPWDQHCAAAPCTGRFSPTFWTQKRLASVTTQVRTGTAAPVNVDRWTLRHTFPPPGDATRPSLWLASIAHEGLVGGTSPALTVNFEGTAMPNRVDGFEGLDPLYKHRISLITNEAGGRLRVDYSARDCSRAGRMPGAADGNNLRCFPTFWTPELANEPILDWFHKYVVTQVSEEDETPDARKIQTDYLYRDAPAWHHNDEIFTPAKYRTWSQWRGFQRVETRRGDPSDTESPQSRTDHLYFRGMNGDKRAGGGRRSESVTDSEGVAVADSARLQGVLREEITYNGIGGPVVTGTINDPWLSEPTATEVRDGVTVTANFVNIGKDRTRTALAGGAWRRTETAKKFNDDGNPEWVNDLGDVAAAGDDQCTRFTYARNTDRWILGLPGRVETVGARCSAEPSFPDDAISDVRTYYDGSATLGAPPVRGDPTRVEELKARPADGPAEYVTTSRTTFDAHGRPLDSFDALNRKTMTRYAPATGGPVTGTTVTNPLGHPVTTRVEPAWGQPVLETDPNGRGTELAYDSLGRLARVWLPGRPRASFPEGPNLKISYSVSRSGPTVVTTNKLMPDAATYQPTFQLYDRLLRPRQTQAPAPGGGRLVTDTFYDSHGQVRKTYAPYFNDGNAGGALFVPAEDGNVPGKTVVDHDGAERVTAEIFKKFSEEQWRTTTTYGGDRVNVDPPPGATATTTISDARGRTTELRQYSSGAPSGAFDATKYTYTKGGQLATVTDPGGNRWSYAYDELGRKIKSVDPDTGTSTAEFDDAGQLITATDGRGKRLAYTYDPLGRRTGEFEGSPGGTKLAEWTYDTLLKGYPTASTRIAGPNRYTSAVTAYDSANRPTMTAVTIPENEGDLAGTYTSRTDYLVDGSIASVSQPARGGLPEETVHHTYDKFGRPLETWGLTPYVTDSLYTKFSEPSEYDLDTDTDQPRVFLYYTYEDGTRRLTQSAVDRETTTDGAEQADLNYTYDPAGNITKIADTPLGQPADVQCMRYDHLRRLTDAWTATDGCAAAPGAATVGGPAPYRHSFTYDSTGNRRTETRQDPAGDTTRTYAYPEPGQPQPHAVRSVTSTGPEGSRLDRFDYDQAGNTTSRNLGGSTQTLDWDVEGRLANVGEGGKATSYLYDADGERLLRRDPSATTLYLGPMELRLDKATGKVTGTRYYTHGEGTIAVRTPAGLNWLAGDHNGTAQLAIDAPTGQPTKRRFTPFGEPRGAAARWPDEGGYVGGTTDSATGLTNLGARDYDPAAGRFISVDPIADPSDPQQLNGYAYANNSPITFNDRDGLLTNCGPDGVYCGMDPNFNRDGSSKTAGQKQKERADYQDVEHKRAKSGVDDAKTNIKKAKKKISKTAKKLAKILADELGITDAVDCFLKGDVGACISTGVNAAFSLIGGAITKLIAKYGAPWRWKKGAKLVGRVKGLLGDLIGGVKKLNGLKGDLKAAERRLEQFDCNSFVPATPVLLANGKHKPIDQVNVGDKVLATDPSTGRTAARTVTATTIGQGLKNLVQITVDTDGPKGGKTGVVIATAHHPVWNPTRRAWTKATDLQPGMHLRTPTGARVKVLALHRSIAYQQVRNLTVDATHTYYVAADGALLLVHNSDCKPPSGRGVEAGVGNLRDGAQMATGDALDTATEFLGSGYRDMGGGRFLSRDGLRQVRMTDRDLAHSRQNPHINFETYDNPIGPGVRGNPSSNIHIYLPEEPGWHQ